MLNSYHIHWYLCFTYKLYLPGNLNENMQFISFVLTKSGLRRDHFWKNNVWRSLRDFILILYKLLKLRKESYLGKISSRNKLFPPFAASL